MTEADDVVRAFKVGNGRPVWQNEGLLLRRLTSPTLLDGMVAVADGEGYLHFLHSDDGRFVGRVKVDSSGIDAPMLNRSGRLIVQANDGSVSAYRIEPR